MSTKLKLNPQLTRGQVDKALRDNGVDLARDKMALLAVRNMSQGKATIGEFDDEMYWVDEDEIYPYTGNVDPSRYTLNVATLAPSAGEPYWYQPGNHGSRAYGPYKAFRQFAPVKVLRFQKDGTFKLFSLKTSINIHHGAKKGPSTSSLGCLTEPFSQWFEFRDHGYDLLAQHGVKKFPVVVVLSTASGKKSWLKGDRGTEVKTIQKILGIKADGIFGINTEAAVIVFQRAKGLVADGVVGAKTMAALKSQKTAVVVPGLPQNSLEVISAKGEKFIKDYEGIYLKAYPDPGTKNDPKKKGEPWTIGFGTITYPNGKRVREGDTCTLAQAQEWFMHEVKEKAAAVGRLVKVPVNQNQWDALVSFAYNCGPDEDADDIAEGLGDSTLLKKLNKQDYRGAADEFPKWNKANGKVLAGLTRRRKEERALFLS